MKIRILRPAVEDLAAGRGFYERQATGLGDRFLATLFEEIDALVTQAGIHRICFGHHRLLSRRFPFAVYYRLVGPEVLVHRVLDCRGDPRTQRGQLQTTPKS